MAFAVLPAETPQEAAKAIYTLIETENYNELFTTRYNEWHKFEQQEIPETAAVELLAKGFKQNRETILAIYQQLMTAEFTHGTNPQAQYQETGETATAQVAIGERTVPFKLFKNQRPLGLSFIATDAFRTLNTDC